MLGRGENVVAVAHVQVHAYHLYTYTLPSAAPIARLSPLDAHLMSVICVWESRAACNICSYAQATAFISKLQGWATDSFERGTSSYYSSIGKYRLDRDTATAKHIGAGAASNILSVPAYALPYHIISGTYDSNFSVCARFATISK